MSEMTMFDSDAAKADRARDLEAAQSAEEAKRIDMEGRASGLARDFSSFAKKSGHNVIASLHGDMAVMTAYFDDIIKLKIEEGDHYSLTYLGLDNEDCFYSSMDSNQVIGEQLPRRIVDWVYEKRGVLGGIPKRDIDVGSYPSALATAIEDRRRP